MPSVSKKQHNLMAAVAHNPAFAKRVGISQSVGKDFNEADKMKRKKFDGGGDVDPDVTNTEAAATANNEETPTPARQLPASDIGSTSFGRAFREARNSGDKTFTWKGKSYNTSMAKPKTLLPDGGKFSMMKGSGSLDKYNKDAGLKYAKGGPINMTKKVAGFFAKKGNKALAAHENREAKGKEKDTKSIAKREEAALKGAPKSMKDYEHKEHKAMGFKKGGMPKSRKGKGMNPAMLAALAGAGGPPPGGPPPGPMAAGPGAAPGMGGPPPGMGGPPPGMGMKKGGMTDKQISKTDTENKGGTSKIGGGIEKKGVTKTRIVSSSRGMGIAKTGTRPAKMYAKGGGIESKGKTRGRFC